MCSPICVISIASTTSGTLAGAGEKGSQKLANTKHNADSEKNAKAFFKKAEEQKKKTEEQ